MKANGRRRWLVSLVALAAAVAIAGGGLYAAGHGVLRPQLLSSESMAREHIFASTDVTDAPSWLVPAFPITRERAIQLAQVDLGLSRAPAGVLITKAGVIPAGAARDVWVVLFAINQKGPMGEPSGAPVSTTVYTLAGELFDAQTGEFYYGFMQ